MERWVQAYASCVLARIAHQALGANSFGSWSCMVGTLPNPDRHDGYMVSYTNVAIRFVPEAFFIVNRPLFLRSLVERWPVPRLRIQEATNVAIARGLRAYDGARVHLEGIATVGAGTPKASGPP